MENLNLEGLSPPWLPAEFDRFTTQTFQFAVAHTNTGGVKTVDFAFETQKGFEDVVGLQVAATEIAPAMRGWFDRIEVDTTEVFPLDTSFQFLMANAAVEPMRRFWRVRQVKADGRRLKGRFSFVDTGTDVYRVFIMLALATPKKTPAK